jgi:hypothetical protein
MSNAEPGTQSNPAASSSAPPNGIKQKIFHLNFWIRELPFSLVLILTTVGVAYTTFSKQPITGYWEILAPLIAIVCVGAGWDSATDNTAKFRLIATQALHWFAFLLVMNMLLLPGVQRIFSAQATQVCLLGLIMALGIPAIAWVENSALLVVLVVAAILGIGAVFWWRWRPWSASKA